MNTHKVYTREQLEALTANELDEVYFYLVGYRPMQDDGISRSECIELILEQYDEIEKHKPATIEQPSPVSAHTPGPWSIDYRKGLSIIEKQTYNTICKIVPIAPSEDQANARLISLAPEMLEVIARYVSFVNESAQSGHQQKFWNDVRSSLSFYKLESLLSRARQ